MAANSVVTTFRTQVPACDVDRYQSWLEQNGYRHACAFQSRANNHVSVLITDTGEINRYRSGTLEEQYLSAILF